VRIENMLWIENIVKSTPFSPFLTNSRVDMIGCVNHHNVTVRSAFSALASA
jgi:hypothetical protein